MSTAPSQTPSAADSESRRVIATLTHADTSYQRVDLPAVLGPDVARFPYVLRILAENVARVGGGPQRDAALAALRAWPPAAHSDAEIAFVPNRLLMHDTTSTPALVDIAAMRDTLAEEGYDPGLLSPFLPVDVSIDHSLAVEAYARASAADDNIEHEMRRNAERFAFLKWAGEAMGSVRLNPPGTGIMHTINLEQLSSVVSVLPGAPGQPAWIAPDVMLGTDSHTPMVNGLGVLGWGIGGLEAEMVMLGLPSMLRIPDVVGVRLTGSLGEGRTATDLAITVTHLLRELRVAGDFVEFFGPGVSALTVGQRAVVANMAPEYGATTGYFPIDDNVLTYLRLVARDRVDPSLVEAYCRANALWFDPQADPTYSRVLEVDLSSIGRSVAGPSRPQDLMSSASLADSLPERPAAPDGSAVASTGGAPDNSPANPPGSSSDAGLPAYPVALAAITSCTNTSDPKLLVTAGLLARRARALGLRAAPWVKTSLAPGSPAASRYLARTGLLDDLSACGFDIVGFGCTTCIGNSGPLPERIEAARRAGTVTPVAILSGNRNFPGRVHPDIRASYIMTPPLVVAFALSGDSARNIETEPVGHTADGNPVMLDDLWPTADEVEAELAAAIDADDFPAAFALARSSESWRRLPSATTPLYPWSQRSTILRPPPFASARQTPLRPFTANPLLVLGDDITTDHISPASAIPGDSPVADFLVERGEDRGDLNVFASRRGNWEVMARGAFYSTSLANDLVPGGATGTTAYRDGSVGTIWDVAQRYAAEGAPVVVIAGERYGMGSSRDWAAKAQQLLGVRAVLAASYERIHRSNLVGMGILPLVLPPQERAALGPIGPDTQLTVDAAADALAPLDVVPVTVRHADGSTHELRLRAAVETAAEVELLREGGAIPLILRTVMAAHPLAAPRSSASA